MEWHLDLLIHWSCTEVLFRGLVLPVASAPKLHSLGFLCHLWPGTGQCVHAVSGPTSDLLVFHCGFSLRGSAQARGKKMSTVGIWTLPSCTWRILSIKRGICIRICITNVSQVICLSLKLSSSSDVHLKPWIEDDTTGVFNTALYQWLHSTFLKQSLALPCPEDLASI